MLTLLFSAKSLQSRPTLCDPMDYSPPDSSVHGILQTRIMGSGYHEVLQGIFLTQGSNSCLMSLVLAGGFFVCLFFTTNVTRPYF